MFFKFTIQTDAKLSTIKAVRTASQTDGNNYWSLRFCRDVVDLGVVTQTPDECQKFIRILILAKQEMKQNAPGYAQGDFTWTVDEYKPGDRPVYFCDRN